MFYKEHHDPDNCRDKNLSASDKNKKSYKIRYIGNIFRIVIGLGSAREN